MDDDKGELVGILEAGLRAGAQYVREASMKRGAQRGWEEGWAAGWAAAMGSTTGSTRSIAHLVPQEVHRPSHNVCTTGQVATTDDDDNTKVTRHDDNKNADKEDIDNNWANADDKDNEEGGEEEEDHDGDEDAQQVELKQDEVLRLSEDWARLFAQGEERRRARDRDKNIQEEYGEDESGDDEVNIMATRQGKLGGDGERNGKKHRSSLKGLDLGGVRKRQRTEELQRLYGVEGARKEEGGGKGQGQGHGKDRSKVSEIAALETKLDSRFQQQVATSGAVPWPYV